MSRKSWRQPRLAGGIFHLLLAWSLLLIPFPAAGAEQPERLLIGIEPEHNIFDQMERHRFLAGYLSEQLGVKVDLTIMSRYGEVLERFKSLKLDGAFLSSYTAAMGIRQLGLTPIVHPVNLSGELTSQGYIFVRKDSGIREVRDMRGKSIVLVDPATMEGYLFPLAYLRQHGVTDLNSSFSRYFFSGSHASAIFAVLDGRAEVGSAKNTIFHKLARNDPSIDQELEIIAQSPKVPEVTLCIKNDIARDLREKLGTVLVNMDKTPLGKEVLAQFNALRFVKSTNADFAKVEEMEQEARGVIAEQGK
ncbi:phosphate/phosphite/phosphonate ABC transporter substrate-binding protein [Thiovibrio sp. JS02]